MPDLFKVTFERGDIDKDEPTKVQIKFLCPSVWFAMYVDRWFRGRDDDERKELQRHHDIHAIERFVDMIRRELFEAAGIK